MAFQASKTSAKQTGFNVGATVVAALTNAGIVTDESTALELLFNTANDVFDDLEKLVAEDGGPKAVGSNYNKKAAPAASSATSPGDQVFNWGKYAGQTIAQVHDQDAGYLVWLTQKDNNPARNFMRQNASAYIETVKAGV